MMAMPTVVSRAVLAAALWISVASSVTAEPARYQIQRDTSEVTFLATSLLQNANGKFHRFSGEVVADPSELSAARVKLSVDTASIDTGITKRDNHLRSDDFLFVERFPAATFQSSRVEGSGPRVTVVGTLTMRGVTREIAVPVDLQITATDLVARGEFTVNRLHYGIKYQSLLNPVNDTVRIAFVLRGRSRSGEPPTAPQR
jgi:polyisoprenoid-binding protein YceI